MIEFELTSRETVRVRGELLGIVDSFPEETEIETQSDVTIPFGAYERVLAAANATGIKVSPVPRRVLDVVRAERSASAASPLAWSQVDAKLAAAMPFQVEGIKRALALNGRVLLADEMGLGKTIQAIGVVAAAGGAGSGGKTLVLCPTSLCDHWVREVLRWTGMRASRVVNGKTLPDFDADVVIGSYDTVKNTKNAVYAAVSKRTWGAVVFDESHALKNSDSIRSKSLVPIMRRSKRLILISGTPQLAMPAELWTQLDAMLPKWLGEHAHQERYCAGHTDKRFGTWDARGSSNTTELALVLDTLMVRRLVADVLKELPPLTRDVAQLTLPPQDLLAMQALGGSLKRARSAREESGVKAERTEATGDQKRAKYDADAVKQLIMKWHVETAKAKKDQVAAYVVTEVLEEKARGNKTIVFVHHEVLRKCVMAALAAAGIMAIEIHGGTPASKRQAIVDRIADPNSPVWAAVFSITACSTGLNCTPGVRRIIMGERVWTPSIAQQAERRAHRIGCTGPVRVTYIEAVGSIDSYIAAMNDRKVEVNIACVGSGAGMEMASRTLRAFRGHEFVRYGVVSKCALVDLSCVPLQGETQNAFVTRTCVPIRAEDFALDTLGVVDEEVFGLNPLHRSCKPGAWKNIDEYTEPLPPVDAAATLWVLVDAPLTAIIRIKAIEDAFERSEAVGAWETCAVFVKQ